MEYADIFWVITAAIIAVAIVVQIVLDRRKTDKKKG